MLIGQSLCDNSNLVKVMDQKLSNNRSERECKVQQEPIHSVILNDSSLYSLDL